MYTRGSRGAISVSASGARRRAVAFDVASKRGRRDALVRVCRSIPALSQYLKPIRGRNAAVTTRSKAALDYGDESVVEPTIRARSGR